MLIYLHIVQFDLQLVWLKTELDSLSPITTTLYFLHLRIVQRGIVALYKDVKFYLLYKERQLE